MRKIQLPLNIRNRVKEAYAGVCSKCGSTDSLAVHHKDHDRGNNKMNNLALLCIGCHTGEHGGTKHKFIVGEVALYTIADKCLTEVVVVEIKKSYGMVRYVVAPVRGKGKMTTEKLTKKK